MMFRRSGGVRQQVFRRCAGTVGRTRRKTRLYSNTVSLYARIESFNFVEESKFTVSFKLWNTWTGY